MWKQDRIRIEQIICEDEDVAVCLENTLHLIKKSANKYNWYMPTCFISYAWPHENYPEETWIQSFLQVLNKHLMLAGISSLMDKIDNRTGGSVYGFIDQLEASNRVIVAGSHSLLLKHKIGKSNVCAELNKIREKQTQDIFPLLFSGEIKTAFPAWFEGYTNIIDWRDDVYIVQLKELLRGLFKLNPDNTTFNKIWKDFENKQPELFTRLQENEVLQLKEQNAKAVNEKLKKTYDYFSKKMTQHASKDFEKQRVADDFSNGYARKADHPITIWTQSKSDAGLFWRDMFYNKTSWICALLMCLMVAVFYSSANHETASILISNRDILPGVITSVVREEINRIKEKRIQCSPGLFYISISGFPGTGKTVLAQQYLDQYIKKLENSSPAVYWYIRSENKSTRLEDYRNLANALGIEFNHETLIAELITNVNACLQKAKNFILVFDNVRDYQDIKIFIPNNPKMNGQIIITSRVHRMLPVEKKLCGVEISLNVGMQLPEALDLFGKLTGLPEEKTTESLIQRLGGLPLALTQAASYIARTKISCLEYLTQYDSQYCALLKQQTLPKTYLDTNSGDNFHQIQSETTYNTVLQFSINQLTPEAQEILHLVAYLSPDNIPKALFLPLGLTSEKFDLIISELEQNSLISLSTSRDAFSIHRVIQDFVRNTIQERCLINDQEKICIDKILSLIHLAHRSNITNEYDYYSKRYLIPHLEFVLGSSPYVKTLSHSVMQGIVDLALLYKAIGEAAQATDSYHKILPAIETAENHLSAEIYRGLGRAYQGSGYFEKAKSAYETAHAIYIKVNEVSSSEMAETLNDLGMIYRDLGHEQLLNASVKETVYFEQAIHYLTQAVSISEGISTQNKNRVRYLSNLAEVYRMLKDFKKAEFNIKNALQLGQNEWSDQNHRLMSSAYFNLGNIYLDQQEYQAAKLCFEKAVEISQHEVVAGKKHPLLARHMDALGVAWQCLGQRKQACEQFQAAHSILQSTNRGQKQLKQLLEQHLRSCNAVE